MAPKKPLGEIEDTDAMASLPDARKDAEDKAAKARAEQEARQNDHSYHLTGNNTTDTTLVKMPADGSSVTLAAARQVVIPEHDVVGQDWGGKTTTTHIPTQQITEDPVVIKGRNQIEKENPEFAKERHAIEEARKHLHPSNTDQEKALATRETTLNAKEADKGAVQAGGIVAVNTHNVHDLEVLSLNAKTSGITFDGDPKHTLLAADQVARLQDGVNHVTMNGGTATVASGAAPGLAQALDNDARERGADRMAAALREAQEVNAHRLAEDRVYQERVHHVKDQGPHNDLADAQGNAFRAAEALGIPGVDSHGTPNGVDPQAVGGKTRGTGGHIVP